MINVFLEGHDYKNEVQSLIKLFYINQVIEFTNDETLVDDQSLLLKSILNKSEENYTIETKLYINGEMAYNHIIEDAAKIMIIEDNLKKKIKTGIKQGLYSVLSKVRPIAVPWGILTGIRPTKIVHELLNQGYGLVEIETILVNTYKLHQDKAHLIIGVAQKERPFIYPLEEEGYSLYISIPFCPTRCLYCSFPSNKLDRCHDLVAPYVDALIYEIKAMGKQLRNRSLHTVYIGGGTPTSIPVKQLEKIIKTVHQSFSDDHIKEFTVEAGRPDTINKEVLKMLRDNKVDRISINPQTMNQSTLSLVGRNHSPHEIIKSYELARHIGFRTINMDLIIGLPQEKSEDTRHTMEEILKLNPDNLTVHTMAIKRASRLKEEIDKYSFTQQREIENMLKITKEYAEKMDMYPYYLYRQKQILGNYENIGYTKAGKECIYNIMIMEEKQTIIATGAGGVSKIVSPLGNTIERVANVKNLREYINRIDEMINKKEKCLK